MSTMDELQIGAGTPMDDFAPKKEGNQSGIERLSISATREFLKGHKKRMDRERYNETPVRDYLNRIEPKDLADKYVALYDANPFLKECPAGAKRHHWWKGGLEAHVSEMIGIGMDLMELYPGDFTFTKSDVIICCFLHDFAKIWLYREITPTDRAKNKRLHEKQVFTFRPGVFNILDMESKILLEIARAGIVPTDRQWSAVLFTEGGYAAANFDYQGRSTTGDEVMGHNPLACFMSVLDMFSAQILGRTLC